ncbi:MAG: hypothetical protein HQK54_13200, partial [Oligoflexales bacterium]|nr:hypothetical protein [Oligoflexales bacterium]
MNRSLAQRLQPFSGNIKKYFFNVYVIAILLYAGLTLGMTYPFCLSIDERVADYGDALNGIFVLNWIVKNGFNPFTYFDTNIMYPLKLTGAMGELHLPSAIIYLPVLLATKNPVLSYNLVNLTCFVLCGFGIFLIVRRLTGDSICALMSGVIFTYFPLKYIHASHFLSFNLQYIFQTSIIQTGAAPKIAV